MHSHSQSIATVPVLPVNLAAIPALLDVHGVNKHLAPIGRTTLYELSTRGEIQTASLGLGGGGKRVFVTASIVAWLQKRVENSKRPNVAPRHPKQEDTGNE